MFSTMEMEREDAARDWELAQKCNEGKSNNLQLERDMRVEYHSIEDNIWS